MTTAVNNSGANSLGKHSYPREIQGIQKFTSHNLQEHNVLQEIQKMLIYLHQLKMFEHKHLTA